MSVARVHPMSLTEFLAWEERVQRYVMVEQDEPAAMVFAREGERWVGTLHKSDAILAMPEIGIEIPLAEFYEGLDFSENVLTA